MKGINQKYPELPRVGDIGHIMTIANQPLGGNAIMPTSTTGQNLQSSAIWVQLRIINKGISDGVIGWECREVGITGNIMVTWDFSGINFKDKGNVTVILTITTRVVSG
ncbi:hypothetical protein T4C_3379 [Trichinella pseudospiralis]|uniref:Uncharacterized protein n=1 Tax=Trichinella pseudospiralis TaxID=6337 RepID=A0A0V1K1C5_TRIPS|nr:hypothetical protein T4C_3379 [Trichinella pseudospiralis]